MGVQEPFYLWFERSGGFTGISTNVEIDSTSLPPDEAEKLKQLIDHSGIFEVQKNNDSPPAGLPDQFQYKITLAYEDQRYVVVLNVSTVPESFRPLINYLTQKARLQKNK